ADVRSACPVTARVRLGFVQRPQPELDPAESHAGIVTRAAAGLESPPGSRKMSRTPFARWSFESPSGTATRPSTTIGEFQWPTPVGSVVTRRPVVGRYTCTPPPSGSKA